MRPVKVIKPRTLVSPRLSIADLISLIIVLRLDSVLGAIIVAELDDA